MSECLKERCRHPDHDNTRDAADDQIDVLRAEIEQFKKLLQLSAAEATIRNREKNALAKKCDALQAQLAVATQALEAVQDSVAEGVSREGLLLLHFLRANIPEVLDPSATARDLVLTLKADRDGQRSAKEAAWRDRDRLTQECIALSSERDALRAELEQLRIERDHERNRSEMYRLERESARDDRERLLAEGERLRERSNCLACMAVDAGEQVLCSEHNYDGLSGEYARAQAEAIGLEPTTDSGSRRMTSDERASYRKAVGGLFKPVATPPADDRDARIAQLEDAFKQMKAWYGCVECGAPSVRCVESDDGTSFYVCDSADEEHAQYAAMESEFVFPDLEWTGSEWLAKHDTQVRAAALANVNSVIETVKAASSPRDPGHAAWDEACDTIREVLTERGSETAGGGA